MKILIMGLPGSGKTTLAEKLARHINAVHFNADDVRKNLWPDLGFNYSSRILQAKRMGHLASVVKSAGHNVICDFVCPTIECRMAFNADYTIFMHTIFSSRYTDTDSIFELPTFSEAPVETVVRDFSYDFHGIVSALMKHGF